MVQDYKGNEHIGARESYRRVYPTSSVEPGDHQYWGGLREKVVHENLELALAKSLTRKDERVES